MEKIGRNQNAALLLLLLWCLGIARTVIAEETATKARKSEATPPGSSLIDSLSLTSRHEPIHVSSRTLEFFYEDKRIVYRDNVVAVQGDVTVKSDLLTVTYEDAPPLPLAVTPVKGKNPENPTRQEKPQEAKPLSSKQQLKEIVAEGHVEITSGDRRATAKKAVFNEAQRVVVLSGDAVMQEGGNQVTGERVTVYLDEKRSKVESGGGSRRAEMVLIPEQGGEERKGVKKP